TPHPPFAQLLPERGGKALKPLTPRGGERVAEGRVRGDSSTTPLPTPRPHPHRHPRKARRAAVPWRRRGSARSSSQPLRASGCRSATTRCLLRRDAATRRAAVLLTPAASRSTRAAGRLSQTRLLCAPSGQTVSSPSVFAS